MGSNDYTQTLLKKSTHKELRILKIEMEMSSLSKTIQKLMEFYKNYQKRDAV